jgi:hypothetical protein
LTTCRCWTPAFAADSPDQAEHLLPMIEDAWQRCLEIGERPDLPGSVAGRGSDLAAHNLALAALLLLVGKSSLRRSALPSHRIADASNCRI